MLTVTAVSGLTLPYSVIEEIAERLDAERDNILKNHKATSTQRLSKGLNILAEMEENDTPQDALETAESIFGKYIN
ncbi:MAG: hypothetical protein FWG65_03810 [Turicibacter sp.]|nr:hypothetical protein [Turicibacter sp.]